MIQRFVLALGLVVLAPAATLDSAAQRYERDVRLLSAPEMEGRGAGTEGLEKAADYIAERFRALGLEPAGETGYRQPFEVTIGAELGEDNRLEATGVGWERSYRVEHDYAPINFSSSGSAAGQVVFVGYGISAEDEGYDDFEGVEVQDKIVLVLRYEPPQLNIESQGRRRHSRHAHLIAKAINARNRGAKAVILVNGRPPEGASDKLLPFGGVAGPADAGVLMIQAKNGVVERWLRRSGKSLKLLQREIDESGRARSFALAENLTVRVSIEIERDRTTVDNVVAYRPGRTDEYVVIGAHYDHLGFGGESSLAPDRVGEVHRGADDNASGVAGLLELARRAAESPEPPRRGVLFIAFAGEEIGLLGSSRWVEAPTRPLDDAVAMINLDMIGRIDKGKIYIGGVGSADSFEEIVKPIAQESDFQVDYSRDGYSASDHTSFLSKRVPALFFFSGLHSDYHKPSDTADKIQAERAVELVGLVERVVEEIGDRAARPAYERVVADPHGGGIPGSGGGGGGYGPYFGSIPDFAEIPDGVRFADIRPDSPAAKAGLEAGDVLTEYDGKPVKNLYDFTYALRDSKVGQTVRVKVLRNGEVRSAEVVLEERR